MRRAGVYSGPMGEHRAPSNGLGIAGFVCSLVGLLSCGLVAPVGLLLSAVAMFRPPRGFAIAGLVLGALGSLWIVAIVAVIVLTVGLSAIDLVLRAGDVQSIFDLAEIRRAVRAHYEETGSLPASLDALSLEEDTLTDSWGARYTYEAGADGRSYTIHSPGRDGQADTADDIDFPMTVD